METIASVIGNDSHTPVIPKKVDNKSDAGIIINKPLSREMDCAGNAFSVEVKNIEITILNPTKGMAVKYNFNPDTAICCSFILCSLLNTLVIGSANR